ncbi:MAG: hypothetical protein WBM75_01070 [Polyangiales bacterium]
MSRLGAIGIAVVGAGGWGKNHVRNYAAIPDADLRYICDRHEGIRESMAVFDDTSADQKLAVFDKGVEPSLPRPFPTRKAFVSALGTS